MYGIQVRTALEKGRFQLYQRTVAKQPLTADFKLDVLPPTSPSNLQHCLRVYHQVRNMGPADSGSHCAGATVARNEDGGDRVGLATSRACVAARAYTGASSTSTSAEVGVMRVSQLVRRTLPVPPSGPSLYGDVPDVRRPLLHQPRPYRTGRGSRRPGSN
ncbi:Structure-specific endonuclease subunit SLX4 [Frankliniella fusca]|uniref:Structure-specific endonuclease subunit SLX4 n=1 Tax=Frankliniella fusca TaxID=407009 RepID=A0AAE1HPE3_9NEOP|nr:Structure-specific endonuclease subunit SLX4 [Frankliniella fusca]